LTAAGERPVTTSATRRPWTVLAWAISIPAALLLIWCAGFLYWRLRMARALADVQRETEARMDVLNPPPSLFSPAGSRAIPHLLREMLEAISRNDRKTAVVLCREFSSTVKAAEAGAFSKNFRGTHFGLIPNNSSLDHLRSVWKINQEWWAREQGHFPTAWMWWSGTRRSD
jgi:hypothetical protein